MKSSRTTVGIGELARVAECRVDTIRYYERIGLMPKPERTEGGQRRYSENQARQLLFIRRLRDLGFSVRRPAVFSRSGGRNPPAAPISRRSPMRGWHTSATGSANCAASNAAFATSAPIAPRGPTQIAASSRRYGASTSSIWSWRRAEASAAAPLSAAEKLVTLVNAQRPRYRDRP
jgi:hypothetical protein